jgi:NADPH-dependent 2,4-dienoyl-CoA reductase/sulfur reductase-like enzyme
MHVVIVGNGVAGIAAARTLRKRQPHWRITVISGESDHHWSRPALMYVYMGHLRFADTKPYEDPFWAKNRIELIRAWVTAVDVEKHRLVLDGERVLAWDRLLLATGSLPNRFGWPGQDLGRVSGMYGLQDLAALESWTPQIRRGIVVGGGLIGVELAEMLHSRGIAVTCLVREESYWDNVLPREESALVTDAVRGAGIDLRLATQLTEIHDDGAGQVGAVSTSGGDRVACEFVGLTAGVRPNISICKGNSVASGRGILVDPAFRTNADDVYAAGDCAEIVVGNGRPNVIQALWYTARAQGEQAAASICGDPVAYDPGIWFNSAKFFDLEYQVYGQVPSAQEWGKSQADGLAALYWEAPDRRRSVRIVHRDGAVLGFNLMGIRFRHRVCEDWIRSGRVLRDVLPRLHEAAFDPELFHPHWRDARRALEAQA